MSAKRNGVRNKTEEILQGPRKVHKEGRRCSRREAEAPYSPRKAYGEAGCPPTAYGHCVVQIESQNSNLQAQPMEKPVKPPIRNCSLWGTHAGAACEELHPMGGSSGVWRERTRETKHYTLNTIHAPYPPTSLEKRQKIQEWSSVWEEGMNGVKVLAHYFTLLCRLLQK